MKFNKSYFFNKKSSTIHKIEGNTFIHKFMWLDCEVFLTIPKDFWSVEIDIWMNVNTDNVESIHLVFDTWYDFDDVAKFFEITTFNKLINE